MNRLQKKCLLGSAVMHGAVALTLVLTTAFSGRKVDDEYVPVMTMVDTATLTDGKSSGGSTDVAPSVPTPAPSQPVPQPVQPAPEPVRPPEEQRPVAPTPKPIEPTPVPREPVRTPQPEPEIVLPKPKDLRADVPAELPVKPDPKKKAVVLTPVDRNPKKTAAKTAQARPPLDLGPVVKRDTNKVAEEKARAEKLAAEAAASAAQKQADQRRNALANAVRGAGTAVQIGTAGKTTVELISGPGGGGQAFLNYGQLVVGVLDSLWVEPKEASSDDAAAMVQVTVAKDGRIISAILSRSSGDLAMDRSVQDALRRILPKKFAPFPEGSTDLQRTYTIELSLKSRRGTG